FIYPFFFAQDGYRKVLEGILDNHWWQLEITSPWAVDPSEKSHSVEEERRHLRYFYPYVREFFFPSSAFANREELLNALSCFSPDKVYFKCPELPKTELQKFQELYQKNHDRESQLNLLMSWQVTRWRWNFEHYCAVPQQFGFYKRQVRFEKISLLLFPTGVGLLLLDVKPVEGVVSRRFSGRFAMLDDMPFGPKAARVECPGGAERPLKEIIENNLLGFLPDGVRDRGSYVSGEAKLYQYHFCCVETKEEWDRLWEEQKSKFRVVPEGGEFQVGSVRGYFNKEEAFILACSPQGGSPSWEDLKRYWRTFYFDIFLHAFYHRLSLLRFYVELSRIDELLVHTDKVEKLHRRFLEFTNKAWFGHLTQAEYGNLIWRCCKQAMETEQLYEEVKTQLQELDEYLERKWWEQREKLVQLLSYIGFSLSFVVTLFSTNLVVVKGWRVSWWEALILIIGMGLVVSSAIWWYLRRSVEKKLSLSASGG
ncbi:MAG: hypothetical protein ACPLRU_06115, partial [Desulfofundulus sp.]